MARENPLQKLSLTAWGGIVIFAAIMTSLIMKTAMPPTNRGALLGQGVATILMLLIGLGLTLKGLRRRG